MDIESTIEKLRDAVNRRRRDLPLPDGLDVDALLEEAIEAIEFASQNGADDPHCDGCTCDDDEPADLEKTLAPLRRRLREVREHANDAVAAIESAIAEATA